MGVVVAILLALAAQQAPPPPGQSSSPPCAVSDDPTYGLTPANPVLIGGGAMYVAARERRYLDALRGPDGQAIKYKRLGSMPQSPNSLTILDHYEVAYDGLEKPISLYLDAYHYWEQRAPKGLTCGQPVQLQPLLDAFQASDSLRAAAREQGAARDFAPIPLDADGTKTHGVMWDGFRTLAMASQAAGAAGKAQTPASPPDAGTVVLAYPLSCNDRSVTPVAIAFVPPQGQPLAHDGDYLKDAAIGRLLPGVSVPPGSLAARFRLLQVGSSNHVRITYSEAACPQGTSEVLLPLVYTGARPADFPAPTLPEGANPAERRLLLQVLIDLDGRLQCVTYVGGPQHLERAAIDAARTWRAEPARINGSPVPTATLLEVRFK